MQEMLGHFPLVSLHIFSKFGLDRDRIKIEKGTDCSSQLPNQTISVIDI